MLLRCTIILLIYAMAVLDTSAPLTSGQVSVHWLTLLLIGAIWMLPPSEATLWGAVIGFVASAVDSGRMGVDVLACSTLACLLATVRQRWECRSLLSLALMASATAGGVLLAPLGVLCLGGNLDDVRTHLDAAIGSAAATAILAVLIAAVARLLGLGSIPFSAPARA